ncbi:MAG TPA: hypothetical protein VGO36_01720 [Solirubrobacterales bacterium]|jgi:hypothetical protein|nr:hypothetical protein [Solirubrobacterales bacterium]
MPPDELSGPDLPGVVADADAAELQHVVIGGFSVIFHGYVRATKDSDLLIPDGAGADVALLRFLGRIDARRLDDDRPIGDDEAVNRDHLRVGSRHGIIDLLRGGAPPLDFETVSSRAETIDWEGQTIRFAALTSLVGFKRLAGRPQDRLDLIELEALHGELPSEPIPGLDG